MLKKIENLKTEFEIRENWKTSNEIVVSINCITYNHENYIEDALYGFLSQETQFAFEILIHDDASTDKTVEIIKEYALKYPTLIKPIFQTENQFSKGGSIWGKCQFPRATGKYIAICDGDDFWVDEKKLQKQIDFLEEYSDFGMVHTNFNYLYSKSNKFKKGYLSANIHQGWSFQEVLQGKLRILTSSACFRRDLYQKEFPMNYWDLGLQIGDWPIWLVIAKHSKIGYIPDVTTVYRTGQPSYLNIRKHNFEKVELRFEKERQMYKYMCDFFKDDTTYVPEIYEMYRCKILMNTAVVKFDYKNWKKYSILVDSNLNKSFSTSIKYSFVVFYMLCILKYLKYNYRIYFLSKNSLIL